MSVKIKQWIKNLPEYIPGRTIEDIKEKYGLETVYKLASNENLFGPSPIVLEKIKSELDSINYYPDSDCRLIKKKLSLKYGTPVENIIIGNGTDQIIEMICDSYIGRDDNIVIADPTFLIYEKYALKCGGNVIKVPLLGFRQDTKGIINSVNQNTKIVFITSPHNPAGTILHSSDFDYLMDKLDKNVLVVIDEAYYEYVPDDKKLDTIERIGKTDNLILLRTFSKIYGLAGLRIGFGMANKQIIDALNKIRLPFNVNSLAQKAASISLEDDSYPLMIRDMVIREKAKIYKTLEAYNISYIESYSNFVLIKIGASSIRMAEELLKNGFIVRPGENLGVPGYIRVTVAPEDINEKFLTAFVNILNMVRLDIQRKENNS